MQKRKKCFRGLTSLIFLTLSLVTGRPLWAHCDALDGPVVLEARQALESGDITPLLKWVHPEYEDEIRDAFRKTIRVRALGSEAREVADLYFLETLVRLHRASEGEPYTGLKPAGHIPAPVAAADRALQIGRVTELSSQLAQAAREGVEKRFEEVSEALKHKDESVNAGRRFVKAYASFVHYVLGLHSAIYQDGRESDHFFH
ncbi:MAG: DUF6448 family protein [Acidobacteriota bacterium]